ncbi:MAG: hypothetical protein NTV54_02475 [Ignavibacteriales bacterium]|nr:hypothetical protein [Ignavibacteriales bacterium]
MTCYMCSRDSVTSEHVPPDCFFPPGHKINLITVPSCAEHNLGKSKDDEYVRAIIAPSLGNNPLGEELAATKVNRSFQRRPGLVAAVFKGVKFLRLPDGRDTGGVEVNVARWNRFFQFFSNAIYYHDFNASHNNQWEIWTPNFTITESTLRGKPNPYREVNDRLLSLDFEEHRTFNPDIFRYFLFREGGKSYVYKFLFYGNFIVCALSTSDGRAFA